MWCPEGSFVALSHLSEAQTPFQHPQATSEKRKQSLFAIGYVTHETTMAKIYGKTLKLYNTINVVISLSLK